MSYHFDLRSLGNAIAVPFKFALGGRSASADNRASRPQLIQRWQKDDNGRLRSKWERDDRN
jgi:hypothetical protein